MTFQTRVGDLEDERDAIEAFIEALARIYRAADDPRPLHLMEVPVEFVPTDEKFQRVLKSIQATTRDISPSGLGIVHDDPILADVAILKLTAGDQALQAGIRILRCEPRDDEKFDVGCTFMLSGMQA